jgi:hypothetical protein
MAGMARYLEAPGSDNEILYEVYDRVFIDRRAGLSGINWPCRLFSSPGSRLIPRLEDQIVI